MKIEFNKDRLLNTIAKAVRLTTNKNSSLPILNCFLFEAQNNQLKIQATNLDIGITLDIPVKTERPGKVAVPAEVFSNLINNLPNSNQIKIDVEGENLKIKTERSETIVKVRDSEDFPKIPTTQSESFKISTAEFVNSLKSVWYSSTHNSLKPELSSVFIYTEDGYMVFAATDSFRLSEKRIKIKQSEDFGHALIPFRNALEIAKAFENEDGELQIYLDTNQISLSSGNIYLTSRLVDGSFPDYKQIIPKKFKTEITVLRQDLVNALKVANVFSDKFNQVNFKVDPSKKTFEVTTKNPEIGENVYQVDAVFTGEPIDINFNMKYITDSLSSLGSDSLTLSFNELSKPMVIEGVGDKSFLYLVMPMNK